MSREGKEPTSPTEVYLSTPPKTSITPGLWASIWGCLILVLLVMLVSSAVGVWIKLFWFGWVFTR